LLHAVELARRSRRVMSPECQRANHQAAVAGWRGSSASREKDSVIVGCRPRRGAELE
jgi:hypothetical protein